MFYIQREIMKPFNKNSQRVLRGHLNTSESTVTVIPKQSGKPLSQSLKSWLDMTDKHIEKMSKDENYRLLVAKSLSW